MEEKTIGIYMTKEEYASDTAGVVKQADMADNAVKLGGKEATYYASADSVTTLGGTVNEVLATANGALSVAVAAQGTANAAMPKTDIVQEAGTGTDKVMSQKAVTDAIAEGRILTVNGQGPGKDGNVEIPAVETVQTPHGYYEKHSSGLLVEYYSAALNNDGQSFVLEKVYNTDIYSKKMDLGAPYAPFVAPPIVNVTIGRCGHEHVWIGSTAVSPTATSFGSYMLMRAGNTNVINPMFNIIAIGRWK